MFFLLEAVNVGKFKPVAVVAVAHTPSIKYRVGEIFRKRPDFINTYVFVEYVEIIVGERVLDVDNSTTESFLEAQSIIPTLGFSVSFFSYLSKAAR